MAAGDNMMDLALKITADPSQAVAAIKEVNATAQAMQRTIAQSLQQQGATAEEAAQIYKQMGINGAQAGAEIKAAYGEAAQAAEQASASAARGTNLWHQMNQGVIGDLRLIRYSMYAFTTPMMFAYIIPQVGRMAEGIREAVDAMEGLDEATRKTVQQLAKAPELLQALQGLTVQEQIADVRLAMANDLVRKSMAETTVQVITSLSYWHTLGQLISGVGSAAEGNLAPLMALTKEFILKAGAVGTVASATLDYNKALKDLAKLEKQLQQEHHKSAHAASRFAQAQQRLDEMVATGRAQLPAYIREIDRESSAIRQQESAYRGTLQILQQKLELERRGFATPAQMGAVVPVNAPIFAQVQMTHQLTAAQRAALPSERELALANAQLAREYPQLTNAEREHWAQVMLTSAAYRQQIDESGRVVRAVHQQKSAWLDLFPVLDQVAQKHQRVVAVEEQFAHAMGQNIATAIVYGNSVGQAVEKALKATLASIAAEALIRALFSTGLGFLLLAEGNFAGAGQAFTAAATFGLIGGASAAAGAAVPGGGGGSAAAASAPARGVQPGRGLSGSPGVAGNEGSPGVASGSGGVHRNIYVTIEGGGLTDTHNLQDLVDSLNQGGHGGTIRLNIAGGSHTIPNPIY